jgi:signal transduction histidine kinase/integral membrane sensor domain MASE1
MQVLGTAQRSPTLEGVEFSLPNMLRELPPAVRQAMKRVAQIAVTFALFSFCNAIAVNFEIEKGVSILFPATAISILACMYFGAWAAIGIVLGTIVTPWSADQSLTLLLISGIISAVEGVIPWAVFRLTRDLHSDLRDMKSLLTFLLFGTVVNTGFSAIAGNIFVVSHPAGVRIVPHEVFVWWIADFTAALLVATPVLAFGGALAARWRHDPAGRPRTITNTLQIVTVVILLGFATSFAIRNYLLNELEDERLEQQRTWARAEEVLTEMNANFLRAAFVNRDDPGALRKVSEAHARNDGYVASLEHLFAPARELADAFPRVAAATSGWFVRTERSLETGQPVPGDEIVAHQVGREITSLHEKSDRANAKAWTLYAAKRRKIMLVEHLVDGLVLLGLILATATLLLRVSRPFAQIRDAIAAMREGERLDAKRISSTYLEFRSIADALEETANELAQREEELRQQTARAVAASQHKSDFLAKMSHELRTPLNSIIGFTDLLKEQEGVIDTKKRLAFLENVNGSAQHLLNLINDLLDLTKVESGKMKLHFENVDLRRAIANTVASTAPLFTRKKQLIEMMLPEEPMMVHVDVSRVEQVLLNLLANANKFSPEGDKITIRSRAADRSWRIEVVDHGIGISAEDQHRIFDEFEQLHRRGPNSTGTGLGLALAKRFVEAHGGVIEVASSLGSGSTFSVTLPRSL